MAVPALRSTEKRRNKKMLDPFLRMETKMATLLKSRVAAMAVAAAASKNDVAATTDAVKGLQATCKACHDVHREQLPDKTYRIK